MRSQRRSPRGNREEAGPATDPSERDNLSPARTRLSAAAAAIAREPHEHVGHNRDNPRTLGWMPRRAWCIVDGGERGGRDAGAAVAPRRRDAGVGGRATGASGPCPFARLFPPPLGESRSRHLRPTLVVRRNIRSAVNPSVHVSDCILTARRRVLEEGLIQLKVRRIPL